MQPFINPNLFQAPGYFNYMNQYQMQQQPIQTSQMGINGKYVNDFSEVTANDVPMNGLPAVFVKNDRSEIQLREWNPNGQIVPTSYRLVIENPIVEEAKIETFSKADILEPILAKLAEFEEQLAKLKPTASKTAKGASE